MKKWLHSLITVVILNLNLLSMSIKKKSVSTARNMFQSAEIATSWVTRPFQYKHQLNHSSPYCISTEIFRLSFVALGQLAFMSFDNMLGYVPFIWL
ncbi:hypothetical protein N474_12495 [Pseudoalteromonas luteoviolacea CPMOR-2]|uniref:hypothetical protein n=1 Tax=Pseudoalteromonas luteoviolacea TaxID=43657 RepID=UPI0007B07EED|nr:hypothetical protein [Pseudoalteromonas luteoviolacea]KZN56092.1 hypothetical protein N474_12495 [Pseudoalteromonas luteoviolacea CPMOR-2]